MAEVLVTGGTGQLGRELVPRLVRPGHNVRVLSRRADPEVAAGATAIRGDLLTGAGIAEAVAGAEVLVHCASGTGTLRGLTYRVARRTDVEATTRLLEAAVGSGATPHVVYISIVGIDKVPLGYYRAKLETEGLIVASGLPYTILRTTQWHTLAWEFSNRLSSAPVIFVPRAMKVQLLDPSEVADRMASLVDAPPAGRTPDMGGPHALDLTGVVRSYLRAVGKRRAVISAPFPGRTVAAFRAGHNLTPDHADGRITWDEWLERRTAGG